MSRRFGKKYARELSYGKSLKIMTELTENMYSARLPLHDGSQGRDGLLRYQINLKKRRVVGIKVKEMLIRFFKFK